MDPENAERSFFFWRWDKVSISIQSTPIVHQSLITLDTAQLQSAKSTSSKIHTMHVISRRLGRLMFGSTTECRFQLLSATTDSLWPTTWGDYLAWVLLSQVQDHATWEEVRIARDAVAMWTNVNLSTVYYQIRKLERHGFLVVRGHRYRDFRNRVSFSAYSLGRFHGEYCGLTSVLYDLFRKVPPITLLVASERTRPAKLPVDWPQD